VEEKYEHIIYAIVLLIVFGVFFGGGNFTVKILGMNYPIMVVVSESMSPNLGVGDFITVGNLGDLEELIVGSPPHGEILVYDNGFKEFIVHRAIAKFNKNGKWWFRVKGDNNEYPDNKLVPEDVIIGRVTGRIPILGYFSLFTKTISGFAFTAFFMVFAFFFDILIPSKNRLNGGKFPMISLVFFFIPVIVVFSFWFIKSNQVILDALALFTWYIGCLILPIVIVDDESGMMFWLYHFVLIMIPIACDFAWWICNVTPSEWWVSGGGTVPINWFLVRETHVFQTVFRTILNILLPGCILFLTISIAMRCESKKIVSLFACVRKHRVTSNE
jgi:signal peptidase